MLAALVPSPKCTTSPQRASAVPLIKIAVGASAAIISRLISIPVIRLVSGASGTARGGDADAGAAPPVGAGGGFEVFTVGTFCGAPGAEFCAEESATAAARTAKAHTAMLVNRITTLLREQSAQCAWRGIK